jgi:hypothetical protein
MIGLIVKVTVTRVNVPDNLTRKRRQEYAYSEEIHQHNRDRVQIHAQYLEPGEEYVPKIKNEFE